MIGQKSSSTITQKKVHAPAGVRTLEEIALMKEKAIKKLDSHRIMAISTVRPDGWPQTTIVGYANEGLVIDFLILRTGQKFGNIQHDDRISVAIGEEPRDLREAKALFSGAKASEVTDPKPRDDAWRLWSGTQILPTFYFRQALKQP